LQVEQYGAVSTISNTTFLLSLPVYIQNIL
jgi:hypothetical protein